jgi:hypothetical protein
VLIVDDDDVFVELFVEELGRHFTVESAANGSTALAAVSRHKPDAVFLDQGLPDVSGIDLIDELRRVGCHCPIIMLTASQDVRVAAAAMRRGAADFIVKDVSDQLYEDIVPTATRAVEKWNNEKELEYLRERERDQTRRTDELNSELSGKNNELQLAFQQLHKKNERLSELYETAHRFVDNVSHEMRTPLTVIKEFLAITLDGLAGQLTDQQSDYLGLAANKTHDLAQMVDDMLDLSKVEAGLLRVERVPCSIQSILESIAPILVQKSKATNVLLDWNVPDDLPDVFCDTEKIGRVFINLVVNGMKFSPEGSTITVSAHHEMTTGVVSVDITDEGPGIPAEHLKTIFERFKQLGEGRRSSTKGFGLGLNIVRELVHLNFGDISVRSAQGQGSTFYFTLPTHGTQRFIERYLDRTHTFDHHGRLLALIQARAPHGRPGQSSEIRSVVAHNLTPFDVVFDRRHCDDAALMVITDDPVALAKRLKHKNQEEIRLSPGSTIDLEFEVLAEWRLSDDHAAIITECAALLAPPQEEAAHAK